MKIKVSQIIPDPEQPRKTFNPESISELKNSLNGLGLIQPITIRPYQDGKYMIIVGERRFTAAKQKGDDEIECIVRKDIDDKTAREMQFAENSQQEDIPPLELGKAFLEHQKKYGMTIRELAGIVGLSEGYVGDIESLVSAALTTQRYVQSGKLDASTAYEISTIKDMKRQEELAQFAVDNKNLSRSTIRQIKPLVESQKDRPIADIYQDILSGKAKENETIRLEAAKKTTGITFETPDELTRAAEALKKEARRKVQEAMTPEQRTKVAVQKQVDKEAKKLKEEAYRQQHQPAIEEAKKQLLNDLDFIKGVKKNAPKLEKRAKRNKQQETALINISRYKDTDRYQIIPGILKEVYKRIAYQSIDVIITDPPYGKEYLYVYGELAEAATYLLKPNGSLLVMIGQSYLPEILLKLSVNLTYHWVVAYLTPGGQSAQLWDRKVNTFWKPILWFVNGEYQGDWVGDVTKSSVNDNDKNRHEWGQSESGMADIIERFSKPDDLILDPFMGAGTTGRVALDLGRRFIGIDKSENSIAIAKQRIGIK